MFEANGVILECTVQIGLGRMTRVTGFSEQAQIGETQTRHQPRICIQRCGTYGALAGGIGESQQKQHQGKGEKKECAV